MRSSTSRCLSAARISRITPRRGLSPPFIAAFMSSVMRALRSLIANSNRFPMNPLLAAPATHAGLILRHPSHSRFTSACPPPLLKGAKSLAIVSAVSCCKRETGGAAERGRPSQCARTPCSVQALAARDFARDATQVALHRRSALALAFLGRLLVKLALARFGEYTGLLASALEAAQGDFERLVLADFDAGHGRSTW